VYQLLVKFGFTQLDLHKIIAKINAPNIGSQVAVQRAGLTFECLLKEWVYADGIYYDLYTYGITEDEWRAFHT
jgi:RimJ/RimL family protein N-acetyltransferase